MANLLNAATAYLEQLDQTAAAYAPPPRDRDSDSGARQPHERPVTLPRLPRSVCEAARVGYTPHTRELQARAWVGEQGGQRT